MQPGSEATDDGLKPSGASMKKVIILDGDSRASLVVIRSFEAGGYHPIVVGSRRDALSFNSRSAKEILLFPSPLDAPDAYAELLMEHLARGDIHAVVPSAEESLCAMRPWLNRIREMTTVIGPDAATLDLIVDEIQLNLLAEKIGIPIPRQASIELQKPLPNISGFPVLLKPGRRMLRLGDSLLRIPSRVARHIDELTQLVRNMHPDAFPCLAQSILTGELDEYAALYRHGEPVAEFAQTPIRDLPPTGGMSVPVEAVRPDEKIADMARRLLKELRFDGPVLVKFKRDEPGGVPMLVAVNASFWPSLQLAIDAGIDFPGMALKSARGEDVLPVANVRYGLRTRWLLGDLEYLVWYLLRGYQTLRFSGMAPTRAEMLARFFRDFKDPAMRLEVKSNSDPKPYRVMKKRYAFQLAQMARRGLLAGIGFGLDRFPGMIVVIEKDPVDFPAAIKELAGRLEKKKLRFAFLLMNAKDRSQQYMDRIVAHCARESSDHLLIIPGLFYDASEGIRILALGVERVFEFGGVKSLARMIRENGGVAVWAGFRPGQPSNQPDLVDEMNGLEVWDLATDGAASPQAEKIDQYVRELDRSPYLVAYQTQTIPSMESRIGRGHITIQTDRLTRMSVLSAMETGLFHLNGTAFRSRGDHLSFLLTRIYISLADRLFHRGRIGRKVPPNE